MFPRAGNKGIEKKKLDYRPQTQNPLSPEEVIERAKAKIGEWSYNVFFNNCENFTNWCRYDKDVSDQGTTGALAMGAGIGVLALVLGGVYLGTRSRNRNQREDM